MNADLSDPVWAYVGGAYGVAALGFVVLTAFVIARLRRWARAARAEADPA